MGTILYIGSSSLQSTSLQRAKAIERLGHTVIIKDPYKALHNEYYGKVSGKINFHTGYIFIQRSVASWLNNVFKAAVNYNAIWIDSGELFGSGCLKFLKRYGSPIILLNLDDPTGKRDGRRFASLKKALPYYDLVVVVRNETKEECEKLGAKQVLRVIRSYDEVAHKPFDKLSEIPPEFKSEVAFIGTWMRHEKRDEFLIDLIDRNVPVSIWGNRWQKSAHWQKIAPFYRGVALSGRNYVAAIQGSKACIGLLSKGNRDLHTTRSLEIPYAGGLLCAERTEEHLEMYKDGKEAVFWGNAEECAHKCLQLLANSDLQEKILAAGMNKVRSLEAGNEDTCKLILNTIGII